MKIKIEKQKLEDNLYLAIAYGDVKKGDIIKPQNWLKRVLSLIPWVFDKKVEEVEFFIKDSDWSNGVCCWIKTDKKLTLGSEYSITTQKTKNKEITYNTGKEETVVQPPVEQTVEPIVYPLQEIYDCIKENNGSALSEKIKQLIEDKGISWCMQNSVIVKIENRIKDSTNHNLYENLYPTFVKIYLENEYYDDAINLYCNKIKPKRLWKINSELSKQIIYLLLSNERKNIRNVIEKRLFDEYVYRLGNKKDPSELKRICRIMAFCYLSDNQIEEGINKIKEINPNSEAIKYLTKINQKKTDAETFAYFAGCFRKFEDWQNYSELFINDLPENLLESISPDNDEEKLLEKTIKSSKSYPNSKLYERYGKLVEKYDNIFEFKQIRGRLRETEKRKLSSLEDILAKIKDNTEFEYCDFSLSDISSKESIQEKELIQDNELIQDKVNEAIGLFTEENCKNANKLHWLVHFLLESLNYIGSNYEDIKKKFEEIASKSSRDLYFVLYCLADKHEESEEAMRFFEEAKKDPNSDSCKLAECYPESIKHFNESIEPFNLNEYYDCSADAAYKYSSYEDDVVEKLKWLFSAAKRGHEKAVKDYLELSKEHPKEMTDEMKSYHGGLERKHWLDEARDIILGIPKKSLPPTSKVIMELDEDALIDWHSKTQENKDLHRLIAARLGEIYYICYYIARLKDEYEKFDYDVFLKSYEKKSLFSDNSSYIFEKLIDEKDIEPGKKKKYKEEALRYLEKCLQGIVEKKNDKYKIITDNNIDTSIKFTALYFADLICDEDKETAKELLSRRIILDQAKLRLCYKPFEEDPKEFESSDVGLHSIAKYLAAVKSISGENSDEEKKGRGDNLAEALGLNRENKQYSDNFCFEAVQKFKRFKGKLFDTSNDDDIYSYYKLEKRIEEIKSKLEGNYD